MNKRSTINDVAKMAGVSVTTVSRVVNNNYPVSERTRKKVNEAIEALGFRPNLLARSLIQDKTNTIGIITPSIENLFFSEIIKGIDEVLKNQDYRTFLCNSEGDPGNEKDLIDSLLNRSVDGIITINPRTKNLKNGFYEGIGKRLPLVIINGYNTGVKCNFILNEDKSGVFEAMDHMINKGHKHLGLLRGRSSYSNDIKEEFFRAYLDSKGIPFDEDQILTIENGNGLEAVEASKAVVLKRLKSEKPLDGLLCCNDWMAVGALNAGLDSGLQIPEAFSIVGFDNTIISQLTTPKITSLDHQMNDLGVAAAKRMMQIITEDDKTLLKSSFDSTLIIRGT